MLWRDGNIGVLTAAVSLEQVYDFVQLSELYYAGSHGMDIMGPATNSDGFRVKGTKSRDKKVGAIDNLPLSSISLIITLVLMTFRSPVDGQALDYWLVDILLTSELIVVVFREMISFYSSRPVIILS